MLFKRRLSFPNGRYFGDSIGTPQVWVVEQIKGATGNIVDFSKSFVVAVWRKHFGEEIVADETTAVENAPGIDKFSLPFFFAIPGEEPIAKDAGVHGSPTATR
jgi:hypothetical protein